MVRRTKGELGYEAEKALRSHEEQEELRRVYHERGVKYDDLLTQEYRRTWRDEPLIIAYKNDRDYALLQASEARRQAKRYLRKHYRLMRKTRWARG